MRYIFFVIILSVSSLLFSQDEDQLNFYSKKGLCYRLFSTTESSLFSISRKLRQVEVRFKQIFGEDPPEISIFLFPDYKEIEKFNFSSLYANKQYFLPFLTEEGWDKMMQELRIEDVKRMNVFSKVSIISLGLVFQDDPVEDKIHLINIFDVTGGDPPHSLHPKDILISINNEKVHHCYELMDRYHEIKVGDNVKVEVLRKGKKKSLSFKKPKLFKKEMNGWRMEQMGEIPPGKILFPTYESYLMSLTGALFTNVWIAKKYGEEYNITSPFVNLINQKMPEWFLLTNVFYEDYTIRRERKNYFKDYIEDIPSVKSLTAFSTDSLNTAEPMFGKEPALKKVTEYLSMLRVIPEYRAKENMVLALLESLAKKNKEGFMPYLIDGLIKKKNISELATNDDLGYKDNAELTTAIRKWLKIK